MKKVCVIKINNYLYTTEITTKKIEIMATSAKELERQAQREKDAKECAKIFKNICSETTFKKYDGTPKHKTIYISK